MPRIGNRLLELPKGVEIKVDAGQVMIKGPKGSLIQPFDPRVEVKVVDGKVATLAPGRDKSSRSLQGLYNSLIRNMIEGVTKGFEKQLELNGVGYRAQMQGKKLNIQIGYSHPVEVEPPEGITFEVEANTRIRVKGLDKQLVGKLAAEIRAIREVEPYKGKGIKYAGEFVRKKAGKAAKAATGGAA